MTNADNAEFHDNVPNVFAQVERLFEEGVSSGTPAAAQHATGDQVTASTLGHGQPDAVRQEQHDTQGIQSDRSAATEDTQSKVLVLFLCYVSDRQQCNAVLSLHSLQCKQCTCNESNVIMPFPCT